MSEFLHILTDPAHLAAEVTLMFLVDFVFLGLMWPFATRWVKRHDRIHHGGQVKPKVSYRGYGIPRYMQQ